MTARASTTITRRQLLRGGALGLGSVAGLGWNLQPARAAAQAVKLQGARESVSVCPFCAVGCSQIVSVRQGQIVNIEGNPDSPINHGTLCPKGSAAFQLAVNPHRLTKVLYRPPHGTAWEEKPLDWAMDRVARVFQETRDRTFTPTWTGTDPATGQTITRTVNHCRTIGALGGAAMDNEWNYAHLKMWRALGLIWLENQARI
jgi:formate dehydrogenase major subunit